MLEKISLNIIKNTATINIKQIYEEHLRFPKEMKYTKSDGVRFQAVTECHICGGELGEDRARDHCHLTGKFSGAAHVSCNLDYQIPQFFPVIFHNISGYDSHLLIKKLKDKAEDKNENIKCIPKNEENYITFLSLIHISEHTRPY